MPGRWHHRRHRHLRAGSVATLRGAGVEVDVRRVGPRRQSAWPGRPWPSWRACSSWPAYQKNSQIDQPAPPTGSRSSSR